MVDKAATSGKKDNVAVTFTIEEGPQWVVKVTANCRRPEVWTLKKSNQGFASLEGQPFRVKPTLSRSSRSYICHQKVFKGKEFSERRFSSNATPDEAAHQVILEYQIFEGDHRSRSAK